VGVGVAGAPGVDVVAGLHLRPLHAVRQQPHRRRPRPLPSGGQVPGCFFVPPGLGTEAGEQGEIFSPQRRVTRCHITSHGGGRSPATVTRVRR
jgi:hypothetical protein